MIVNGGSGNSQWLTMEDCGGSYIIVNNRWWVVVNSYINSESWLVMDDVVSKFQ